MPQSTSADLPLPLVLKREPVTVPAAAWKVIPTGSTYAPTQVNMASVPATAEVAAPADKAKIAFRPRLNPA